MRNWTEGEYAAKIGAAAGTLTAVRSKYGARKKELDGVTFDSTAEANAYVRLKVLESAGEILNLKLQPFYIVKDGFRDGSGKWWRPIQYRADFSFLRPTEGNTWRQIAVDVKGFPTPAFKLKEKLFRAKFPDITLEIWK